MSAKKKAPHKQHSNKENDVPNDQIPPQQQSIPTPYDHPTPTPSASFLLHGWKVQYASHHLPLYKQRQREFSSALHGRPVGLNNEPHTGKHSHTPHTNETVQQQKPAEKLLHIHRKTKREEAEKKKKAAAVTEQPPLRTDQTAPVTARPSTRPSSRSTSTVSPSSSTPTATAAQAPTRPKVHFQATVRVQPIAARPSSQSPPRATSKSPQRHPSKSPQRPKSTIAAYIHRFRTQSPKPPTTRQAVRTAGEQQQFWWQQTDDKKQQEQSTPSTPSTTRSRTTHGSSTQRKRRIRLMTPEMRQEMRQEQKNLSPLLEQVEMKQPELSSQPVFTSSPVASLPSSSPTPAISLSPSPHAIAAHPSPVTADDSSRQSYDTIHSSASHDDINSSQDDSYLEYFKEQIQQQPQSSTVDTHSHRDPAYSIDLTTSPTPSSYSTASPSSSLTPLSPFVFPRTPQHSDSEQGSARHPTQHTHSSSSVPPQQFPRHPVTTAPTQPSSVSFHQPSPPSAKAIVETTEQDVDDILEQWRQKKRGQTVEVDGVDKEMQALLHKREENRQREEQKLNGQHKENTIEEDEAMIEKLKRRYIACLSSQHLQFLCLFRLLNHCVFVSLLCSACSFVQIAVRSCFRSNCQLYQSCCEGGVGGQTTRFPLSYCFHSTVSPTVRCYPTSSFCFLFGAPSLLSWFLSHSVPSQWFLSSSLCLCPSFSL